MINTIKSRKEEAEKGCGKEDAREMCGKNWQDFNQIEGKYYCESCLIKIKLLHSILFDLVKKYRRLNKLPKSLEDKDFITGRMLELEQFTGYTSDELNGLKLSEQIRATSSHSSASGLSPPVEDMSSGRGIIEVGTLSNSPRGDTNVPDKEHDLREGFRNNVAKHSANDISFCSNCHCITKTGNFGECSKCHKIKYGKHKEGDD